jgi:hypothetical protein
MNHTPCVVPIVTPFIRSAKLAGSAALATLLLACTGAATAQEEDATDQTRMRVFQAGPDLEAPASTGVEALPGSELWAQAQLITTYSLNEDLNPFDIKVDVEGDKVILTGSVETSAQRELAGSLARDLSGIAEVDNRLRVAPAGDLAAPASPR